MSVLTRNQTWTAVVTPEQQLSVSKAIEQIDFIARSYERPVFASAAEKNNFKHDLALEHANHNLQSVQFELLDLQGQVLFRYQVQFNQARAGQPAVDSARGVELPLLDHRQVREAKFTYTSVNLPATKVPYRHLFHVKWSQAKVRPQRPMDKVDSEHASKVTGGRLKGQLGVDRTARRGLVVTNVHSRGYAFANEVAGKLQNVFLLGKFSPGGMRFHVGQRLSALVIQTPRGLQAREIRPA